MLRVIGFTDDGEARLADDSGRVVAYGELRVEHAALLERGVTLEITTRITWVRDKDPEDEFEVPDEIDWDDELRKLTDG